MSINNVLITGGHGLLGTHLREYFPKNWCPTHDELDIRSHITLTKKSWVPNLVIHCAAIKTTVCEEDRLQAMETNIIGTANVARLCHECGAKMVYISTDYVFKGDKGGYRPDDEVSPVNYYAETKLAGEYVVKSLPEDKHLIIRLSFYPDIYPHDTAYIDQWATRYPVSEAARSIAGTIVQEKCGVVHCCALRRSIYEFALATAGSYEVTPIHMPIDDEYKRPRDTSLFP